MQSLNKTYNANVPLVLMNSFNTDEETQLIIQKYTNFQVIYKYSGFFCHAIIEAAMCVSFSISEK